MLISSFLRLLCNFTTKTLSNETDRPRDRRQIIFAPITKDIGHIFVNQREFNLSRCTLAHISWELALNWIAFVQVVAFAQTTTSALRDSSVWLLCALLCAAAIAHNGTLLKRGNSRMLRKKSSFGLGCVLF